MMAREGRASVVLHAGASASRLGKARNKRNSEEITDM